MLSIILIFASFPLAAFSEKNSSNSSASDKSQQPGEFSTKDEVIYGKLDAQGNVQNMYVVNSFHITEPGRLIDYGDYTDVRNLTDLSKMNQSGKNKIQFQADDEEFYYQGELNNKPLPWDISITYFLNGKEITPSELAGKSGQLEIHIDTSANKDVNQVFFENYLLQVSLTLDPLIFQDIQAPKGTEANEGKNKLITFSVMPEQEEVFIVSANVNNVTMDPIEISAVPANIALEDPDTDEMAEEFQTLANAISDINSGVKKLNDGVTDLHDGTKELRDGSKDYLQGMNKVDQSSNELISGSEEIKNVLIQVSDALDQSPDLSDFDLDDLAKLPEAFRAIAAQLRLFADNLDGLNEAFNHIPDIPDAHISKEQVEKMSEALQKEYIDPTILFQLVESYYITKQIQESIGDNPDQMKLVIDEIASNLETAADEIEENMKDVEQLSELEDLQTGLGTLASEYGTFHDGLVSYTDGISTLTSSYKDIDEGISGLTKGTSELNRGVSELYDGTKELHEETSDLPEQLKSEIEEMLEDFDFSDFEPTSFISEQNKKIGVVQFVLRTESIEIKEPEKPVEQTEEKKGIWQRFLDLFR